MKVVPSVSQIVHEPPRHPAIDPVESVRSVGNMYPTFPPFLKGQSFVTSSCKLGFSHYSSRSGSSSAAARKIWCSHSPGKPLPRTIMLNHPRLSFLRNSSCNYSDESKRMSGCRAYSLAFYAISNSATKHEETSNNWDMVIGRKRLPKYRQIKQTRKPSELKDHHDPMSVIVLNRITYQSTNRSAQLCTIPSTVGAYSFNTTWSPCMNVLAWTFSSGGGLFARTVSLKDNLSSSTLLRSS